MHKIVYLESALLDLEEIYSYILDDNNYYALKVILNIKNTVKYLESFPYIWSIIRNELRLLVESKYKYKVVYKINWNTIEVVSIFKNQNTF